jgi:ABC-type lipoprotein export system ATPase subunit
LGYLGIEKRARFFPSQLSGGEKQRVAIARALINNPQILLCDEPTGNLDIDSQNKVTELLGKLNKEEKKTIIVVTHNPDLARAARRTVRIESGRVM